MNSQTCMISAIGRRGARRQHSGIASLRTGRHSGAMAQIRPATPADIPALHTLVERAYRGDSAREGWTHEADLLDGQRTDPDALAVAIQEKGATILLLATEGLLLGCVHLKPATAPDTVALGLFAIDPAHQAGGLGKALLTAAERHAAQAMKARRIEMTVIVQRDALIAWYERRGYARTGELRPFPLHDARFGLPRRRDLAFAVLARDLPG
jgi:ribosomal protein S18 acetylase RimI-like enzyme